MKVKEVGGRKKREGEKRKEKKNKKM